MKKFKLLVLCSMISVTGFAQNQPEPEFVNSYCILTSDSTFDVLPKENGIVEAHQNKFSKLSKIAGTVSDLGFAGGMVSGSAGSMSGLATGIKVMGTAAGVSSAADAVNALAGVEGMDIVFSGSKSAYTVKNKNNGVRLLIKAEANEQDPMDIYRIVKFKSSKKDRRVQWVQFNSALLASSEAKKKGYVSFTGHKYGNQSYVLEIPAVSAEPGEYGIFYLSIVTATAIPVGTFSISK